MADRPNILFINTDQLRADFLGCYGFPRETSPNIDQLAAEGLRCGNCFTASPICTPARYSLLSGQYVQLHGAKTNGHAPYPTVPSLVGKLSEAGYHTAALGKLHHNPPDSPYGFDEVLLHDGTFPDRRKYSIYSQWLISEGIDEDDLAYAADVDDEPEKRRLKDILHWGPCRLDDEHCESSFVSRLARGYARTYTRTQPLFMYLSFLAPHSPYCPPRPYDTLFSADDMPCPPRESDEQIERKHPAIGKQKQRYGEAGIPERTMREVRAQYAGLVAHLDRCIGEAVETFRERFGQDSIVIVTSDHGDFLGEHHKCEKHYAYDAATRVPCIVCWPGHVPAGVADDTIIEQIDLLPTVLGLVGGEWNRNRTAGRDRSGELLAGGLESPGYVFSENYDSVGHGACYVAMARSQHRKLIMYTNVSRDQGVFWEFYDLDADPWELDNRIDDPACAAEIASHRQALLEWYGNNQRYLPPPR